MSFLRRLFNRSDEQPRQDSLAVIISDLLTAGKLSQFDYVSYLRRWKIWDVDVLNHREEMAKRCSVAFRIVHLADHIFAHGFDVIDEKEEEELDEFDIILEEMERLQWRRNYKLLCQYERTHGYSAMLIMREGDDYRRMEAAPSEGSSAQIDALIPISATQIKQVDYDLKTGLPSMAHIQFTQIPGTTRMNQPVKIHADHFQWVNVRPHDTSLYGVAMTKPCWPQLVWYHSIQEAMSSQAAKVATGLLTVPLAQGASETEKTEVESAIKEAHFRKGITYPESTMSKPEYIAPPMGQTPLVSYLDNILGDISIVSELPKTYLLGTEAGAVTGSVINNRQVFAAIRREQENYEPYIQDLMALIAPGLMADFKAKFKWRIMYSLGRMEEAELDKTQAESDVQRLSYLTVNELRKEKGLPPVADGDLPLSLQQTKLTLGMPGGTNSQSPQNSPKPRPQAPQQAPRQDRLGQLLTHFKQDSWPQLRAYAHQMSEGGVEKACKYIGISTDTYYKWSEKYVAH